MGETDIAICLKKRHKDYQEYQKNYRKAKNSQYNNELNNFFNCDF